MENITSTELRGNPGLDGELISTRVRYVQEKRGVLVLEVCSNGSDNKESRHLFLTDALQLLGIVDQIRSALLPSLDGEILASLDRIEKKLNE